MSREGAQAHHLHVRRTARYYTLGARAAPEAWVVLHGYGQQAAFFLRHFRPHAGPHRLVVAPEALSRFYLDTTYTRIGASWMTREDREAEIADTVAYLDAVAQEVGLADAPVNVLGFSQGAAAACRWAAYGTISLRRLVLWGGDVPADLDLDAHGQKLVGLTLVVGESDEIATPTRIAAVGARLQQHGVPFQMVRFAGGHRLHAETLGAVVGT